MRAIDYLRLGFEGVRAHKKHALMVALIVGPLFSVIIAGVFFLQGLENISLAKMLAPTKGKVVVVSSVETKICGKECNIKAEVVKIKKNIEKYGGQLLDTKTAQMTDGIFYKIEKEIFTIQQEEVADDVMTAVAPFDVAIRLYDGNTSEREMTTDKKLQTIETVNRQILGKIIKSQNGKKYYIAGILPSEKFTSSLSLSNLGMNSPLNLILEQVQIGASRSFIVEQRDDRKKEEATSTGSSSGLIDMENIDTEEMGLVFATFADIESAHDYFRDKANYCSATDRAFEKCGKDYRYLVSAAVSNPIATYDNFQNIWLIFKAVSIVVVTIAVIIALGTYVRLIGKDTKMIALYHLAGATNRQIRLIYVVYLVLLSIMTIIFALTTGLILATILSLVNKTALEQVFMLGFGASVENLWLIGWNNLVLVIVGAMLLTVILIIIISNKNFRAKELAKRIK